jgi:hypothetical protein
MRTVATVLACVFVLATSVLGQAKPQAPAPQERAAAPAAAPAEAPRPLVPLKVQIVLSRMKGDKKVSSLPYVLGVTANDRIAKTSLRMGVEVPVPTGNGAFSYRSVGTNIDCDAHSTAGDAFRLSVLVQDSSLQFDAQRSNETAPDKTGIVGNVPVFRQFNSSFQIVLRDGQTTQYTSAVDPISGEVMKIDITLTVLK